MSKEKQILQLIQDGYSQRQIASTLRVSRNTVAKLVKAALDHHVSSVPVLYSLSMSNAPMSAQQRKMHLFMLCFSLTSHNTDSHVRILIRNPSFSASV